MKADARRYIPWPRDAEYARILKAMQLKVMSNCPTAIKASWARRIQLAHEFCNELRSREVY